MIYIITPCSRPENIRFMVDSIPERCQWVISFDARVPQTNASSAAFNLYCPQTGASGNHARNFALDSLILDDDDWVYILDDDNIIHPRWYDAVKDLTDPTLNMVAWGQVWRNGSVRLEPTFYPRVGTIDTSCYMVRGRLMKHLRYELDYVADGILAERAFQYGGYHVIHDYLGYYNYLRTPTDRME